MYSHPVALSRGRPGRTCILMQSAVGPAAVHCVWECLSILKARVRCNYSGSAKSMQSQVQHNFCQRMRARKELGKSHSDPECGSSTSPPLEPISKLVLACESCWGSELVPGLDLNCFVRHAFCTVNSGSTVPSSQLFTRLTPAQRRH